MGNFKIEIEAVGGHGVRREITQGHAIPYDLANADDPDVLAKLFVEGFTKTNNVLSAKLIHWPDTTPIVDNLLTGIREYGDFSERWQGEEMLRHFGTGFLPEVARPFCHLAYMVVRTLPRTLERTVALRKLLEAMDAALRAAKP